MDVLSGPIPTILSATFTTLKTAYGLYDGVTVRKRQTGLLLDRCRDLVGKVAEHLGAAPGRRSKTMTKGIDALHKTCEDVLTLLTNLRSKPFIWCMLHTEEIDDGLKAVENKLIQSFRLFSFTSQLESDRFQQEMKVARIKDREILDQLVENDQSMLAMLQEHSVSLRKIEVALSSPASNDEDSTGRAFLQNARTVLRRNTVTSEGSSATMSSLEITWSSALRPNPVTWKRGDSSMHVDRLVIPRPPTNKRYRFRVVKDETNLGIRPTYALEADGSQVVNLLEYNAGYGIHDNRRVRIYASEDNGDREVLIAERMPGNHLPYM